MNGIQGGRKDDLTYHARYSGAPDRSEFIYSAAVAGATTVRQWTKYPAQKSKTYTLQAGQRVYLEAIQKEAAGDPDKDGIQNHLEWANQSDPQVKNSIRGALLHEFWWDVPGFLTASLDTEPRLLQPAHRFTLATRTQGYSYQSDHCALRMRGYLTAPVTGTYTFWAAGDDQADVSLSTSESKYAKELLIRTNTIDRGMDSDISQTTVSNFGPKRWRVSPKSMPAHDSKVGHR